MVLLKAMVDWASDIKNNPDAYLDKIYNIETELNNLKKKAENDEAALKELQSDDLFIKVYQEVKVICNDSEKASKRLTIDNKKLIEIKTRFNDILTQPLDTTPIVPDSEVLLPVHEPQYKATGVIQKQFDASSHGFNIHLESPKCIVNRSEGNLILSEKEIRHDNFLSVVITSPNISNVAIGVCSPSNSNVSFLHKSKKNCHNQYIMFGDGFYLLDGKAECQLKENEEPKFAFASGDKLEIFYDILKQQLALKNLTSKRGVFIQMRLDEKVMDNHFCIVLPPGSKATIIEDKKHGDKHRARFSANLKGSLINFVNPNEAEFVENSTVGLLDNRLLLNQIYKFGITEHSTGFLGLGVAHKPTLEATKFTVTEESKPAIWMFYANGLKSNASDYILSEAEPRLTFKKDDTVHIWLDSNSKQLICRNIRTGISDRIDLSGVQDLQNIYPAVDMRVDRDKVRIQ
jgi:hypothetical protein